MTYEGFAYIYDHLMEHAPYESWIEFTETMISKNKKQAKTVLDLGCGTGEVSLRLAHSGYEVTGVDYSSDMLSCALDKMYTQRTSVTWIKQDITELAGFHDIDVCLSYCDVMNYIQNETAIEAIFSRVYDSLTEGGLFMFDVHDMDYANKYLIGHTFAEVTEDISYIWDCEVGQVNEMLHYMTFFQREGHHYIRFDEMHRQKLYERHRLEDLLYKIGFTKIEFYLDFNAEKVISSEQGERVFIVAKK